MAYTNRYRSFLVDKNNFFQKSDRFYGRNTSTSVVRHKAYNKGYRFIADNKKLIEDEFNHLWAALKNGEAMREEFWLYAYYLSILLQTYHIGRDQNDKAQDYQKIRHQIWMHYKQKEEQVVPPRQKSWIAFLGKKAGGEISDLVSTPAKISKLREKVGLYNAWRLYWAFSKMTLSNLLLLLKEGQVLNKLGKFLGKDIDVDGILAVFEAPSEIMRALSVGFFGARFLMNLLMTLKHTFAPTDLEKEGTTIGKRFGDELWERHTTLINDVVWGVINGITNYNEFFHISAPAAGWIVAGFLVFDVCLLLWRRHLEEQKYLTKKAQYLEERELYLQQLNKDEIAPATKELYLQHLQMLNAQLTELDITWQATDSTFWFNISAALLLMAGFTAAMIVASPALIIVSYAVCMTAVGMYLSDGAYKQYKEKSLRLQQSDMEHHGRTAALQEYRAARSELVFTLLKNTLMPSLIIATFAICWQAAIVLTALYLGYELWSAYRKHRNAKMAEALPDIERREGGDVLDREEELVDREEFEDSRGDKKVVNF